MARDEMTLHERWDEGLTGPTVVASRWFNRTWYATIEDEEEPHEFCTWREAYDWLYGEVYGTD